MFQGGYKKRLLRVDAARRAGSVETIPDRDYERFLGGRGLGALWYWRDVPPDAEPLSPENKIGIFTGPLTGAPLVATTKIQMATKGPETGRYLCSNSSSYFGPRLLKAGFDGLVIQGASDRWTAVVIDGDRVSFLDDDGWAGLTTEKTREKLLRALPAGKWGTMAVGPAAENGVVFSSLHVDEARAFGRGGGGAVLGAKRIKAVAVRGDGDISVADPGRCKEILRAAKENLNKSRARHRLLGTAQLVEIINGLGCMPTRNYQASWRPPELVRGVDAQTLRRDYYVRNTACFRCTVGCGQWARVAEGRFAGAASKPEYESIGLLGPCCGINEMDAVIAADEVCNQLGMDTITAGNMVAFAMELFERGLVGPEDNDGLDLRFGDAEGLLRMLDMIARRRGLGALLAGGVRGVLAARPEWEPYLVHVKGMPFPAYDPRGFHGMGLAYATSTRGACHNVGGYTVSAELLSDKHDRYAVSGKGIMVKQLQDNRAYVDSVGICTVVRGAYGFDDNPSSDTLLAVTGHDFSPELMTIGERIVNLERAILVREGVSRKDDRLPPRMMEPLPDGPAAGHCIDTAMLGRMLDEYYQARGWDADGKPTRETIERLALGDVVTGT